MPLGDRQDVHVGAHAGAAGTFVLPNDRPTSPPIHGHPDDGRPGANVEEAAERSSAADAAEAGVEARVASFQHHPHTHEVQGNAPTEECEHCANGKL
jgi:hypothetical protein